VDVGGDRLGRLVRDVVERDHEAEPEPVLDLREGPQQVGVLDDHAHRTGVLEEVLHLLRARLRVDGGRYRLGRLDGHVA
jgi:hypothetical protein